MQRRLSTFTAEQQDYSDANAPALIDSINVYYSSMDNSKFQYCDEKTLTVGGSDDVEGVRGATSTSGSAIYISNFFKQGMCSADCHTFQAHPQLSEQSYFRIKRFEVWGFSEF